MAEVQAKFGYPGLQITFSVAEAIVGGQVVEFRTGSRLVGVAGAASAKVAGVARWDVPATRTTIQQAQVGDGDELLVARKCVIPVVASGAIAVGDKLVAAAAGKVRAYVAGTDDAGLIIGEAYAAAADAATFNAFIR